MNTSIPKFQGIIRPRIYNWIGTSNEDLYWDDPNNWAEGEYPDHPEATVVFADALTRNVNVILRKDIFLANIWFSEPTFSYKIMPEGDPEKSRLMFQTGQQLANITLDEQNQSDHEINAMILHSCKKLWWRPTPWEPGITPPARQAKLLLSGDIGSYKEAPRASLNVDGFIEVELSGNNSFIGPIVVNRGTLSILNSESVPPRSSLTVLSPGILTLGEGVTLNLGRLVLDGEVMTPGKYVPVDYPSEKMAALAMIKPEGVSFKQLNTSLVRGNGILNVLP